MVPLFMRHHCGHEHFTTNHMVFLVLFVTLSGFYDEIDEIVATAFPGIEGTVLSQVLSQVHSRYNIVVGLMWVYVLRIACLEA